MTRNTHRNNFKPVFRCVTLVVMILLCWFWAVMALQRRRFGYFASQDYIIYSVSGPNLIWMSVIETLFCCFAFLTLFVTFFCSFALFALMINSLVEFVFFSLLIRSSANFTTTFKSIFMGYIVMKFRNWFDCLAFRTLFCLNCLRHGLFPFQKGSCLEPIAAHTAVGSLYCMPETINVK